MKLIKAILFSCFFTSCAFSQVPKDLYNFENTFLIILAESQYVYKASESINDLKVKNCFKKVFSFNHVDSLNKYLDAIKAANQRKVYLVIIGDQTKIEKKISVFTDIKNYQDYDAFASQDVSSILSQFLRKEKWQIDIIQTKSLVKRKIRTNQYRQLSLGLGWNMPIYKNTDDYIPNSIFNYSFNYSEKNHERIGWNFNLDFGIKRPKPQEQIQSAIQSQINPEDILAGGVDSISIDLETTLKGHVYSNFGFNLNYYLESKKAVKPFLRAGLNFSFLNGFSVDIDTTFSIDVSDISSSNGPPSFDQGDPPNIDDTGNDRPDPIFAMRLPLTVGVDLPIGEHIVLTPEMTYFMDLQTFNPTSVNANSSQFKVRLGYRFFKNIIQDVKYIERNF